DGALAHLATDFGRVARNRVDRAAEGNRPELPANAVAEEIEDNPAMSDFDAENAQADSAPAEKMAELVQHRSGQQEQLHGCDVETKRSELQLGEEQGERQAE